MRKGKWNRAWAVMVSATMIVNSMTAIQPVSAASVDITKQTNETSLQFSFGTKEVDGYTLVTKDTTYQGETGYGFSTNTYEEEAVGWSNGVYYPRVVTTKESDASYVTDGEEYLAIGSQVWTETESTGYGVYTYENTSTFDVDVESKDYTVTVELVNPTEEAITVNLEAEDITKVSGIEIKPGEKVSQSYTACVVDGQLNAKFLVNSNATTESAATRKQAYVSRMTVEGQTRQAGEKPTIFIASDSTVQTYDSSYYPQTGWGQVLYQFFDGADAVKEYECEDCNYSQAQTYETSSVIVENRAIGGRSSKSFIEEGKLDDLLEDVKPGDYVLVQWGHNDATAARPNRYVSTEEFGKWIQYYIDGVSQRGGTCILVTPVARRSYTEENGVASFKSDFEAYRQVMLSISEEQGVPLLDLTKASIEVCNKFGAEGSKALFLWLNAGDYTGYYAGGASDSTHLQYYGAYKFAQCVARLMEESTNSQLDTLKAYVSMPNDYDAVPAAPGALETGTIGASSISFSWDKADGAELYYIYRAELGEGQSVDEISFTADEKYSVSVNEKYTDSNCEADTTYVYAIAGFNELGVGEFSEKIQATTKSALYKYDFCQSSSDPTMEGWTQVTSTQAYTKEAGYGWISAPGNGRYRSGNGNADSNDMTDDFCLGAGEFALDLPNGDYELKITACDLLPGTSTIKPSYTAEGVSIGGISTKQAAGTLSATVRIEDGKLNLGVGGTNAYINGLEVTPVSLAPSGLMYQELSFTSEQANFLLTWLDTENAVSYNVYRKSESDSSFSLHKTITQEEKDSATTLPFVAELGETYEYYVTAILKDGTETAKSNTIAIEMRDTSIGLPDAPTGLTCSGATENSVSLSWDAVQGIIKYIVYRSDRLEGEKGYKEYTKIAETKEAAYTDTSVTTNIHWYYKVVAVNANSAGEASLPVESPIMTSLTAQKAETLATRGLVAINLAGDAGAETKVSSADSGVYLSWRLFEEDPEGTTFTVIKNGEVLAEGLTVTNYLDGEGTSSDTYQVVGSSDETGGITSSQVATWKNQYLEVSLDVPEDQTMPDGTTCSYTANDMSVGDLDGDGQYELVVKWYPSNAQDNSKSGYTGTTILDAYDIDINNGTVTKLWRIDLGINIRSGAHYTQFMVWDLDGDGCAEVTCKTADGTKDGVGTVIGDATADYRNSSGYVLDGPEYFTVFSGKTGEILDTVDYIPTRGNVDAWGDGYGNRVDRFLAGVAYLDGETPSVVACRGYYTRTCVTAYDFVDGKLVERFAFDTDEAGSQYEAQGNHSLAVADIDGDQKDEIIYGGLVLDHDGTVKYSTGLGHGDAMHVSDWIPSNPGLEIMSVHEHSDATYQVEIHDAETGEILTGFFTGVDTGRGMAADINPIYEGAEFWSSIEWNGTEGGLYSSLSSVANLIKLSDHTPSVNFSIFWDGDLLSELQDHTFNNSGDNYYPVSSNITKWDYENNQSITLFESTEALTSNGTKGNLGLVADLFGDWREEIIARTNDESNSYIRIYSTTIATDYAVPTLMENHEYRLGVAIQNVGYNQPAHTSYLLSEGVKTAEVTVLSTTSKEVTLTWTQASDGTYGHEVTGYQIERYDENSKEYIVVATVDAGTLSYEDKEIKQNSVYSYKVAAIVDGKASFRSAAVQATTALDIKEVPALTPLQIVQDTLEYEEAFPSTVTVIDMDGNRIEGITITWELSDFDISKIGSTTVYGTINGFDEKIPLEVQVTENIPTGYEPFADVYMIIGTEAQLPEKAVYTMANGTSKEVAVEWDLSTLDVTKTGSYTVYGSSIYSSDMEVKVYVKENYIVSVEELQAIEAFKGEAASLPEKVSATYADGTVAEVMVNWSKVDTSTVGAVIATGTIEDYAKSIQVTVNVIKKPLYRFDFGINSGNIAEGWTGVTVNPKGGTSLEGYVYTKELGYGFADTDSDTLTTAIQGRFEEYEFDGGLPKAVYQDFALPASNQFKVDVPNGFYTVQVVAGSAYKSSVKVSIEGASNVNIANAANQYTIYTAEGVEVTDGQLNFVFPSGTYRMNAIMITSEAEEEEQLPTEIQVEPVVTYQGSWTTGSIAEVTLTNTTGLDFYDGWTVEFDCEREITSLWGATLVGHEGNHYIVTNPSYKKELLQGESIVFGFLTGDVTGSGEFTNVQFTNIQYDNAEDNSSVSYEYSYASDWGTGAVVNLTVTNDTGIDFTNGWNVAFDYVREIDGIWNGQLVSNEENHYVIKNPSWDTTLAKGESITISFTVGEGSRADRILNVELFEAN